MCISPNMLSDRKLVACRKCWQCLEHKVDNWVGRCIAESKMCVESAFITLTYGRDENGFESHERSAILTYSDVQKFVKRLRFIGVEMRYFAVGEVGSEKGRAHWHILAFFKNRLPQVFADYGNNAWHRAKREVPVMVPMQWNLKTYHCPLWPHGFSHWTRIQPGHAKGSIRYACKYIHKDANDDSAQSKLAMSKTPPLGTAYFETLAQKYVDEGIAPRDGLYMFPNEAKRKSDGRPVRFRLEGRSAELFCQAFLDKWREQRGGHAPYSEYIEEYCDKQTRLVWDSKVEVGRTKQESEEWKLDYDAIKRKGVPKAPPVVDEILKMIEGQSPRRSPELVLTQSEWVVRLSETCVFWITKSVRLAGRWKLGKTCDGNGKRVWMQSIKDCVTSK